MAVFLTTHEELHSETILFQISSILAQSFLLLNPSHISGIY